MQGCLPQGPQCSPSHGKGTGPGYSLNHKLPLLTVAKRLRRALGACQKVYCSSGNWLWIDFRGFHHSVGPIIPRRPVGSRWVGCA